MSGARITEPGIYELAPSAYHGDPCPVPSLNSGTAKLLARRSPLHAWHQHARLGGAGRAPTETMEAGSIIHRLMLGRGDDFEAVDADDWRTKAAKDRREEIRAAGRIPVLAGDLATYRDAAAAALEQMLQHPDCADFFEPGLSEAVAIWREEDAWLRCMVDRLPANRVAPWYDLKTTRASAAPADFQRAIAREHAFQRAFYLRAASPLGYRPQEFLFVVVEQQPPHGVSVMTAAASLAAVAEREVDRAIALWRRCLSAGAWPGYEPRTAYVDAPAWALAEHEMAEMEDAE